MSVEQKPVCECGARDCGLPELPLEAWEFAGVGGIGKGPDGTDGVAILPSHLTDAYNVEKEGEGWLGCSYAKPWPIKLRKLRKKEKR